MHVKESIKIFSPNEQCSVRHSVSRPEATARYYLENGIFPCLLAEDERVSTSALEAERQVGQVRANSKRALMSKMFSHGT